MSNINEVLQDRNSTYGDYLEDATLCQSLKDIIHEHPSFKSLEPDMKQSLEMFCVKMARILNGDPYHVDSWHDISGYATLIVNRLNSDLELYKEDVDVPNV